MINVFLSFIHKHDLIDVFRIFFFSSFPCNDFCVFLATFALHMRFILFYKKKRKENLITLVIKAHVPMVARVCIY